jgi:hypothetical protein
LLELATTYGYELVVDHSWSYDTEVTHGWFQRKANRPVDGLPERFTVGLRGDGAANVVAGAADCWWPANRAHDFDDETLSDLVNEVTDHFTAQQPKSGWFFDTFQGWGANESGCAVVGEVPLTVVTVDSLYAVLVEAGRQLGLAFQQAEDLFAKLSIQRRTP